MLRAYVSAGFDPAAFWQLTPRLYVAHMRGAGERAEREQKAQIQQAWVTAALMRSQKMPDLDKVLTKPARPTPEKVRAQLNALKSILPKITLAEWRARKRGSA